MEEMVVWGKLENELGTSKAVEDKALSGKVEGELDVKASAVNFFEIISSKNHYKPPASPGMIQQISVHESD